jgi:hypothetical protein
MTEAVRFDNTVSIRLTAGDTGKVLYEDEIHNDISDDLLGSGRWIYVNAIRDEAFPWCFILRDGPKWAGFTWDRTNPWAPYSNVPNNLYDGAFDPTADAHWMGQIGLSTYVNGRWKRFYRWTKLADDLQLKAIGLTGWDMDQGSMAARQGCINGAWSTITPQSLIILPSAITVRGNKGGSQVQDILEISYYLSVVGVN